MKQSLIILTLIISCNALGQDLNYIAKLKQRFNDSGYVNAKQWVRAYSQDTSQRLLKILRGDARRYYDDALMVRRNVDFVNRSSKWVEDQVTFKLSDRKFTYAFSAYRAERFGLVGQQLSTDLYWVPNKNVYANLDVAIGERTLYPLYRGAIKLYYTGIKGIEAGAGYGYIQFLNNPVRMGRLSLGIYLSSFYFHVEYLNIQTSMNSNHALLFRLRNYLANGKGYFILNGSVGMQSDKTNLSGDFVNSNRFSAGMHYNIIPRISLEASFATEKQKIREGFSRDIQSVNICLIYHFQTPKRK